MIELIRFPQPGDAWQDTREGGMYVFAVVPKPDGHRDNCTVENGIVLTSPDRPVSDVRDLWIDPWRAALEDQARTEAADLLEKQGLTDKADLVHGLTGLYSLSSEVLAAVHMGSTSRSLKANSGGRYWEANPGDLTSAGVHLLGQLHDIFGITPTLLTFLDT